MQTNNDIQTNKQMCLWSPVIVALSSDMQVVAGDCICTEKKDIKHKNEKSIL